jgi:hypothetical protein
MIVADPTAAPFTKPVVLPTVAIPVAELLHVPPVVASANVVELPKHITALPEIADGKGFTVIGLTTKHPVPKL